MNTLAVYVHWPFCKKKCPYCDFNSHVRDRIDITAWHVSYLKELSHMAERVQWMPVSSVFFGGGTPSLMPPALVGTIIDSVAKHFKLTDDCEITLEANPTSAEAHKFADLKKHGVNRLSLGVQSLFAKDLAFLGREHTTDEALKAIEMAAHIFDRYSFDLIYARPNQTINDWNQELLQALNYAGDHLSLYQLTIEKGTPFFSSHREGSFTMPNNELAADLYQLTDELMASKGYHSYEISNYAKEGQESRHNMHIWRYGSYIGIGPGAHGRIIEAKNHSPHRVATTTHHDPDKWLKEVSQNGHGIMREEHVENRELVIEALMMGLRLKEGVSIDQLIELGGENNAQFNHRDILVKEGLLEDAENRLIATDKGRLVLNKMIEMLVN